MSDLKLYTPDKWADYELIDTGGLEKLERFGKYILARPEPQAVWEKSLSQGEWDRLAHATYKRARGIDPARSENAEKGEWKRKPGIPDQWIIRYAYKEMELAFRLGFTAFGHIGVFPEQAVNWEFLYDVVKSAVSSSQFPVPGSQLSAHPLVRSSTGSESVVDSQQSAVKILNLFAYTGGASLAAKAAGADVVHVDSVRQVINWAKDNMSASRLKDIRWVVEDALKFVRREVKRGNRYDGIILDPPAYGRGPEGEKWVLQDLVNEMVSLCSQLLSEKNSFLVFSLYSMGFSALIGESLVTNHFRDIKNKECGELYFSDKSGRKLPLGTIIRFRK